MASTRLPLDGGEEHALGIDTDGLRARVTLQRASSDRRSPLHEALLRHVRIVSGGVELALSPGSDDATLPDGIRGFEVLLGRASPLLLASVSLEGSAPAVSFAYLLSPFETRFLADTGAPHPAPAGASGGGVALSTDLHTHMAGCVGAADLLAIGVAAGVRYPAHLLAEAGIDAGGDVALADLPAEMRRGLGQRLVAPADRQITFLDMERIYRLRAPITKSPAAMVPLLRKIAEDYRAMGARHVELSFSDVVEAARLRAIRAALPAIEAETGVTIRFLAAMSRHDDWEWDQDYIARLEALAACPEIVGVDFMGHETSSTRAFARQIRAVAELADRARPGFVVRVHAGENPAYPENVRAAIEAVGDANVELRIGHGLYGADDATLDALVRRRAVVEFNLNSNLALNNIQSSREVPLRRYLDRGAFVVLGTDGYGIYQTTLAFEVRAAMLVGLDAADLGRVRATEDAYVARRREHDARAASAAFVVPDDAPLRHYGPEVASRRRRAMSERDAALAARLEAIGVPLLDVASLDALLAGREILCVAGAWATSWEAIAPDKRREVRALLGEVLAGLLPERAVLVTGGTRFGVENELQELARGRGFTVLGAIVRETPPASLEPGAITHAHLVGEALYDKAAGLYRLVKDHGGLCVFIGGGPIVSDEIQTASNLRARYLLMDGPEGASTAHAQNEPERAFRTAADVLRALACDGGAGEGEPFWYAGPNPTADAVVTRASPRDGSLEVLLIRRDDDAQTETGRWALPGGFVRSASPRGAPWAPGAESAREACVRELAEETGLELHERGGDLLSVGEYEGGGRDPRDTAEAWSRSSAFAIHLEGERARAIVAGGDDACDARWWPAGALPARLAFDHARILADAFAALDAVGLAEMQAEPRPPGEPPPPLDFDLDDL